MVFEINYDKEEYDEEYVQSAAQSLISAGVSASVANADVGLLGLDVKLTYIGKLEDSIWQND